MDHRDFPHSGFLASGTNFVKSLRLIEITVKLGLISAFSKITRIRLHVDKTITHKVFAVATGGKCAYLDALFRESGAVRPPEVIGPISPKP